MTDYELNIEERLTRLEENQERRLAIIEELDDMLTRNIDQLRHTNEQLDALDRIQDRTVVALASLDSAMDAAEADIRRMNNMLAEQRAQTDELIHVSGIQGTSIARLWDEFRRGKGSGNGDSAGKDVK